MVYIFIVDDEYSGGHARNMRAVGDFAADEVVVDEVVVAVVVVVDDAGDTVDVVLGVD